MPVRTYKYSSKESEELDDLIVVSYDRFIQLERRNLLVISFVIIFSSVMNINPSKGSFLGLTFENFSSTDYYLTLLVLVVYFLSAFIVYGYPNYKLTLKKKDEIAKKAMTISSNVRIWHIEWSRLKLDFKYLSWLFLHYLLPVILGLLSIVMGIVKIV